jgi:flagellar FliJ protein
MPLPSALDLLIDLAQRASDERARTLGVALAHESDNAKRLSLLQDYRRDYQASFAAACRHGLSPASLRNFHEFLAKLDSAIAQQTNAVEHARHSALSARAALSEAERKRQSLVTVRERRRDGERRREQQREQKQHDEFAVRGNVPGFGARRGNQD